MARINARDWLFQIESLTVEDTWLDVENVTSFSHNPSENEETTDTTHFGSDGEYEGQAMQRGASVNVEGQKVTPGPGQAEVEKLGTQVGEDSLGSVRFRHKSQDTWTVWPEAYVSVGEQGGGTNDKTGWSATFTRSGSATTEPVA